MRWLLVTFLFSSRGTLKSTCGISPSQLDDIRRHTRMRTRLSFRSTSVMASLLERDMVDVVEEEKEREREREGMAGYNYSRGTWGFGEASG